MIKELQISTKTIFLEGLSLKGEFQIYNPNKILAISFEIQPIYKQRGDQNEKENFKTDVIQNLSIFPRSGLLLKQETQKITVMAKNMRDFQKENLLNCTYSLCLKYHFLNNFNRILIKNKKIKDLELSTLQQNQKQQIINIEVSSNNIRIKDQIQTQVLFTSSLAKQTLNISKIKDTCQQTQQDVSQVCTIINSLQINSKIKSRLSKGSFQQKQINEQQFFNQKKNNVEKSLQIIQNNNKNEQSLGMVTANCEQFSKTCTYQSFLKQGNNNSKLAINKVNSLELILLAILAGFCYSLGSNLNHFIYN